MGRKVFREFAHVLCHQFVEAPSNRDLVNLAVLGDGTLVLAITEQRASHNGLAIEPFPFAAAWLGWATARVDELAIPRAELRSATLTVEYTVGLRRRPGLGWLCARFAMTCTGAVAARDREYRAELTAEKEWGLSCV